MKDLIVVRKQIIGNGEVNAVDARELHAFLESKQEFAHWIKSRIEKYEFTEGIDFVQFDNFIKSDSRARIEYAISLDMAKELAMVERNDKGKQARQYFIECEKRLMGLSVQLTPAQMLLAQAQQLVDMERVQIEQAKQIEVVSTRLDQIETATDHFAVIGYMRYMNMPSPSLETARKHGMALSKICKRHNIEMGKIPQGYYGRVNTYPKYILNEYFESLDVIK